MGMKSHDHARAIEAARIVNRLADDAVVPAVHGIENADRRDNTTIFLSQLANP
jgi:hypothetical protein